MRFFDLTKSLKNGIMERGGRGRRELIRVLHLLQLKNCGKLCFPQLRLASPTLGGKNDNCLFNWTRDDFAWSLLSEE